MTSNINCNPILGNVPRDTTSNRTNFSSFSSVSGQICDLTSNNIQADQLFVNNLASNSLIIPENAIRVQISAPFSQTTDATTFLQNSTTATYNLAEKYPLDNVLFNLGTVITLSGPGDIEVNEDGIYNISYVCIFQAYSGATPLPLGIPGSNTDPVMSVSGTGITFVAINDTVVDASSGYAHDYFNFQTIQPPINSGSVSIPLVAGDRINVYNYAARNSSFQTPGIITTAYVDLNVVKLN